MSGNRRGNSLIVIENGQLTAYPLDDRLVWKVGRASTEGVPDIRLHSVTVSRKHGQFQNVDGVWFYLDRNGKNGTVCNGKHVEAGIGGRIKPIALKDGDVLIFGGGKEPVINSKTIWTLFLERTYGDQWDVEDTRGWEHLVFGCGDRSKEVERPSKGTVIRERDGIAIYMGDITYLAGDIAVTGY